MGKVRRWMGVAVEWVVEDVIPAIEWSELCVPMELIVFFPRCVDVKALPKGVEYRFDGFVVTL